MLSRVSILLACRSRCVFTMRLHYDMMETLYLKYDFIRLDIFYGYMALLEVITVKKSSLQLWQTKICYCLAIELLWWLNDLVILMEWLNIFHERHDKTSPLNRSTTILYYTYNHILPMTPGKIDVSRIILESRESC